MLTPNGDNARRHVVAVQADAAPVATTRISTPAGVDTETLTEQLRAAHGDLVARMADVTVDDVIRETCARYGYEWTRVAPDIVVDVKKGEWSC